MTAARKDLTSPLVDRLAAVGRPVETTRSVTADGLRSLRTVRSARQRVGKRRDPLVLLVTAVALGTYLLRGFTGLFSRDLGVYAYAARQVLAGEPPYVGIVNRAGPLAHLLPVPGIVAARVTGSDELLGMRVWYLVLAVACVSVTYLVGRDLFASRLAGLAAAATMLSFEGFISLATTGPREKTPMVLFILCALWALSHRRWLLTGVSISLATLTIQIAFFPLLAAAVVGILLVGRGRRLRDLTRVTVGGAIPVAVLGVYFAASGALGAFLDGFLLLNARYSVGRPFSSRAGLLWGRLQEGYGASLWPLLGGLVLVIAVAVALVVRRSTRRDPATATMVALAVATVGSLLWTEVDFDGWEDAFTFLPLAALGIGAGIAQLEQRLPGPVTLAAGVLTVVLPTASAVQYAATVHDHQLVMQREVTRTVLAHVPGARIWSIDAPQYLVLAERTNPTRYQLLSEGLQYHVDDTWPGGMDAFVTWNLAQQPELLVVNGLELREGHWRDRVQPEYVRVGRAPGVFWFARSSLGTRVIHAIQRDLAAIHARSGS